MIEVAKRIITLLRGNVLFMYVMFYIVCRVSLEWIPAKPVAPVINNEVMLGKRRSTKSK
jgi:hypothetical protein